MVDHADIAKELFDRYAGADNVVDFRELQLILNHAFSQGTRKSLITLCSTWRE